MNLLVDIGNSAVKTAFANGPDSAPLFRKSHGYSSQDMAHDLSSIIETVCKDSVPQRIGISLLHKQFQNDINEIAKRITGADAIFVSPESKLPFRLSYERTIGSDRLCSSAAAYTISEAKTVLTIDFGTATTFTIVSDGELSAGMICPGVGTSYRALISGTSLPEADLRFPEEVFSSSTVENIRGGVLWQSLFAAERIIDEAKKLHGEISVYSTGGYSELIGSMTGKIDYRDPDLVLKGINILISS